MININFVPQLLSVYLFVFTASFLACKTHHAPGSILSPAELSFGDIHSVFAMRAEGTVYFQKGGSFDKTSIPIDSSVLSLTRLI